MHVVSKRGLKKKRVKRVSCKEAIMRWKVHFKLRRLSSHFCKQSSFRCDFVEKLIMANSYFTTLGDGILSKALCSSHTASYRFTAAALLFNAALYILICYNHAMEVNNRGKIITKKCKNTTSERKAAK